MKDVPITCPHCATNFLYDLSDAHGLVALGEPVAPIKEASASVGTSINHLREIMKRSPFAVRFRRADDTTVLYCLADVKKLAESLREEIEARRQRREDDVRLQAQKAAERAEKRAAHEASMAKKRAAKSTPKGDGAPSETVRRR